jgi:hypothetical protein
VRNFWGDSGDAYFYSNFQPIRAYRRLVGYAQCEKLFTDHSGFKSLSSVVKVLTIVVRMPFIAVTLLFAVVADSS